LIIGQAGADPGAEAARLAGPPESDGLVASAQAGRAGQEMKTIRTTPRPSRATASCLELLDPTIGLTSFTS
jgi:hypothetical protein